VSDILSKPKVDFSVTFVHTDTTLRDRMTTTR